MEVWKPETANRERGRYREAIALSLLKKGLPDPECMSRENALNDTNK